MRGRLNLGARKQVEDIGHSLKRLRVLLKALSEQRNVAGKY